MPKFTFIHLIKIFLPVVFAVSLTGELKAAEPTIQTQGIFATQGNCNEIDLSFIPGDGSRRIVIGSANGNVSSFPQDFHGYIAGSLFGTGSNLGNNNYVVYNGSGNSVTVTGLTGGTEYYFAVFEYNGTGNNANYLLANYPEASAIALGISMSIASSSGDMCEGDSVHLEAHGAETYSWSPSSTLSSSTDSAVWAKPTSTTTYHVQGYDAAGCSDDLDVSITVYTLPNVHFSSLSGRCVNGGTLNMNQGSPVGGSYSGSGVSGNQFNPSVAGPGVHVLTYTYSDIHGCTDFDTSAITVYSKPNASFPSLPDVCIDATPFDFNTGTPSGGIYSGSGVSGGQLFTPSVAGVGNHTIKYIYTNSNGCADTAQSTQQVRALPNVTFATLPPVCISTSQYSLTQGTPAGGTYSGAGVSNTTFSPQVTGPGTYVLTYSFTDSHSCSNSDTSVITVNTLPSVSLAPLPTVCANTGPVTLSGGSPAGGTYSGTAVAGTIFYTGVAGPGQHTVSYSYTDANTCTNSASQTITVNAIPQPNLGNDITACSDETVTLSPGAFTGYTWSTGVHSSSINVDTTGRGLGTFMFTVTVSNANNCINRDTVLVTFDACNGITTPDKHNFVIYPNPSTSSFTFVSNEKAAITVFDMNGAELYASDNAPVNFGALFPPGSYLVRILQGDRRTYRLLIKQ